MATKTTKTTKTTKSKTTKTTKTPRVKKSVVIEEPKKQTVRIKKVGEDKFKFVVFIYEDRGKDKVAIIDGLADFVEDFCVNSTSQYNIKEKDLPVFIKGRSDEHLINKNQRKNNI